MPRSGLTSGQLAALSSNEVRPAIFLYGEFGSGPLRVWSGQGTVTWGGHSWLGLGGIGDITPIEEGVGVDAKGIVLTLSGFDATLLNKLLSANEFVLGKPVIVYLGLFDTAFALIDTPYQLWAGRLDKPKIHVDGITATIQIACENRLIDMNTPVDRRWTDADQQLVHPGDRAFEFVNQIQNMTIYWGRTAQKTN